MENIVQKRNVIVGTAGHVDHGKTWLIKALTGVDTDRLKEEQKRGITIEPGFAQMQNENNVNIGIIDVPGHEKFIKNMLAGIGGIDIVLLVVAADEGIMPQTKEHFEITSMLDIKHGIVVITKTDLVDEDWLEMVKDDIREYVQGTFLEDAPVTEVSAYTGKNIALLKDIILQMAADIDERRDMPELFRLPVDRVFTMDGFGTVVTGTLIEGSVSVGDEVEIYPQGIMAKVRNIRIHGSSVEQALAGQRTAINLTGIRKEEVSKGDVIAYQGSLRKSRMVDVKINIFDSAGRVLKNGDRLHFYYGSAGALCKAILLDKENLSAGESGFAQLRLEEEIAVRKGDRFILRFYSPLETIGGGIILDANPQKRKRFSASALSSFEIKETGTDIDIMEQTILEESKQQTPFIQIAGKLDKTYEEAQALASVLADRGKVVILTDDLVLHRSYLDRALTNLRETLSQYHKNNPISIGMKKEELRNKLEKSLYLKDKRVSGLLLRHFVKGGSIKDGGTTFAMPDFTISYSKENEEMKERILVRYLQAGCSPDSADDMIAAEKNKDTARQIVEQLVSDGKLEKITAGQYIDRQAWDKAVEIVRDFMEKAGSVKLAEFRDALGTSRKYAILLLEAFDERGMTKLEGEVRIPGPAFRK